LSAILVVPSNRRRIRPGVREGETSYIRILLGNMRATKWKESVRRCGAPKSKASIMANNWDGSRRLGSETWHTIRKQTSSHRDGLNIVTRRVAKTPKMVRGKRRIIDYRSSHSNSIGLQHCNCSSCRCRRSAINYRGIGS
jgi:hypothetical protein